MSLSLQKDLENIICNLRSGAENEEKHSEGLVIIVSLVTSCLRAITVTLLYGLRV